VALSTMTNAAIAVVEQALLQERTELLLSLLKTMGLSWPAAKQVLQVRMRVRPMSEADIEQCLANYERLKPKTAELVVRFHTKGASRSSGPAPRSERCARLERTRPRNPAMRADIGRARLRAVRYAWPDKITGRAVAHEIRRF